ncbi:hypothetical protein [Ulvibacterium sp.]|uniref:hypothetical protein n=1 Tax=Ulvibacterium sp. TaxID=2665914 RepID=UPI003BA948E7
MKTTQIFLFALLGCTMAFGQTNTFPASGDVGIGTTTPSSKFHVYEGSANGFYDQYTFSLIEGMDARLQLLSTDAGNHGSSIILTNETSSWTLHQRTSTSGNRFDIGHRVSSQIEDIVQRQNVYLSILNNGNVGIGTTSPNSVLHVSKGTSGDAILRLEADTDNNNDFDNPMIEMRQDGDIVGINIGFSENFGENKFGIGARHPNSGGNQWNTLIVDTSSGNIGMGTQDPGAYRLAVNGNVRAKEVRVETGWSDFVFEKDYDLPTLEEVETYIKERGHLKDIPSTEEVAENGILLGEMDSKLLQKIEELTLYIIDINKKVEQLQSENSELKRKLELE